MKKKMNNPSWCCDQIQKQIEEWKQDLDTTDVEGMIEVLEKILFDITTNSTGEESMKKSNNFDVGGKLFLFLEKPFLLIFKDMDKKIDYVWLKDEAEIIETAQTLKSCGYTILEAMEIGSYRGIEV